MESHRSTKCVMEFVRDVEQLKGEALLRQGPVLVADDKLLGTLMEFLLSEQSSEEQALLERFYSVMLRCYRTADEYLMRFVNEFTFCFVWRHFSDLMKSRQYGLVIRPGLDAFLLSVYNLATVDNEGQPRIQSFTIPSLANPSMYHDPSEFTVHILKDHARSAGESDMEKRLVVGNYPPVESLTRTKKWAVFHALMRNLCQDLPYYSTACQKSCIVMCRLLMPSSSPTVTRTEVELSARREPRAFDRLNFKSFSLGKEKYKPGQLQTKIILDEMFLLDMLDVLYVLAYQGLFEESLGLICDILHEGEYRILASVVVLASAIKSRLDASKQDPDDLDDVPPIATANEEVVKKTSAGSMREKRRRSLIFRKESQASRGDSVQEITEVDDALHGDLETPHGSLDYGDGGSFRSLEASTQSLKESSPHSKNSLAETIV